MTETEEKEAIRLAADLMETGANLIRREQFETASVALRMSAKILNILAQLKGPTQALN